MRTVELVTLTATLVGTAATIASIRFGKRRKPSPIQRWRAHRAARSTPSSPE
jgi:hypothetical protein